MTRACLKMLSGLQSFWRRANTSEQYLKKIDTKYPKDPFCMTRLIYILNNKGNVRNIKLNHKFIFSVKISQSLKYGLVNGKLCFASNYIERI